MTKQMRTIDAYVKMLENDCKKQGKVWVPGYQRSAGVYVHGYCKEVTSEYPNKKTLKESYAMGAGDYVDVYEPMNPLEDLIGGEVKFRHSSGNKTSKRRRK